MVKTLDKTRSFIKSDHGMAVMIGLIVILVGTGAYALGKLSEKGKSCVEIYGGTASIPQKQATSVKSLQTASVVGAQKADTRIVASKSGTRYYYSWCAGANRIKEENRVYFTSESEAEARDLTLAKNCN